MAILSLFKKVPITALFITLSCLFSVMTWFGHIHLTLYWFVFDSQLIFQGQVWRVITPIFLHFPALGIVFAHLAFNMIWLWQFGVLIERFESSHFLLWLIIIASVVSNVSQALVSSAIFGGMSGVVYALLGYLFMRPHFQASYPVRVPNNIAYVLLGFMLLSATGLFGESIANTAHFVGFIVGGATAYMASRVKT